MTATHNDLKNMIVYWFPWTPLYFLEVKLIYINNHFHPYVTQHLVRWAIIMLSLRNRIDGLYNHLTMVQTEQTEPRSYYESLIWGAARHLINFYTTNIRTFRCIQSHLKEQKFCSFVIWYIDKQEKNQLVSISWF